MKTNKKTISNQTLSAGVFRSLLHKGLMVLLLVAALPLMFSCVEPPKTVLHAVRVHLNYPDGFEEAEGVSITLGDYVAETDYSGTALFLVPDGLYDATASEQREDEYFQYNFNALRTNISITDTWSDLEPVELDYTVSATPKLDDGDPSPRGRVIVKEIYNGGCQKDDGSGAFNHGVYIILYNNSNGVADLTQLSVATTLPANGHATNNFLSDGALTYASEGWLPAGFGVFYFPNKVELAPGEQLVIALTSAIDNTKTYSQAINFANPAYYAVYDPESGYNNATYYPAPAVEIPNSHFLKAVRFPNVTSNAYIVSVNSPALFLFTPPAGSSIVDIATDASRLTTHGSAASQAVLKVPVEWIVDGVEVFDNSNIAKSNKRITPDVDGGWVGLSNTVGHTLYRNVNKEATEAIAANAGKLVYNYAGGTADLDKGSTDSSGIDAEASIKNGARIIYKDTNNSTNDFHQRKKASLRD
jgi:hypothetical protein